MAAPTDPTSPLRPAAATRPGATTRSTTAERPAAATRHAVPAERLDPALPEAPTEPTGLQRDDREIKLVELRRLRLERVLLVGVAIGGSVAAAERSLDELRRLAETAGAEVLDVVLQRRERPDASTFIGKGKAQEVAELVRALGADTVVMDDELSPGQLRQLEDLVDAKVIDRTALILDIFAQHARSREG